MRAHRRVLAFTLVASLASGAGCSQSVAPGSVGTSCDTDEQCDANQKLVCKCVRRRNPDEEGPDEILAHGSCQVTTYKCSNVDTGVSDGKSETTADTPGAEASDASETSDASDASDGDATDAAADGD